MLILSCLFLLPGQIVATDSADFSAKLQTQAVTATVRINVPARKGEGSGVVVGKQGPFVYILTAQHIVQNAAEVDITVFTAESYPKPHKTYAGAKVVARTTDARDLALVRMVADDKGLNILPLCPKAEFPKTDSFAGLTVGCSQGQAPTAAINKIVAKRKVRFKAGEESVYFWEWNDTVPKGRSGGPLLDRRGYVVGICSGTNDGKGYYTHPQEIHGFLKKHVFDWLVDKE